MLYEWRTYEAMPGKLLALKAISGKSNTVV
jgi:hypothetical protein